MCNDELYVTELKMEVEDLRDWRYRLENALEIEQELNRKLRDENENLHNKIQIYKDHIERLKKAEMKADFLGI